MASANCPIAIVGMSCRLPEAEADNTEELWKFLLKGGDSVREFPAERRRDLNHVLEMYQDEDFAEPSDPYFSGSVFKNVDMFDADFFNVNPADAVLIDPQQRFFLRSVWEALEDAGLASQLQGSNTGIYVGNAMERYKPLITSYSGTAAHGNHPPFIASRVSYLYDLRGPALMVSTGCSSSLLAVHLACQGLLNGDCDMAIAGGVTLDTLPLSLKSDIWNQIGIAKLGQKCYAFDSRASRIAKGEGVGVVILKPLQAAMRDKNYIHGVLIGTGSNQDGTSNGITAPNPAAQSELLSKVWKRASIHPSEVFYFEAHGTGTQIGDPIEAMAIDLAFENFENLQNHSKKNYIGSIKANIGHLADGAAGVVSLIKVLLCMKHGKIPPQINLEELNKKINWKNFHFQLTKDVVPWASNGMRRLGAVSSFGLVGTNVHAILQDPTEFRNQFALKPCSPLENGSMKIPLLVNAKTIHSLIQLLQRIQNFILDPPAISYDQFATNFNTTRMYPRTPFKCLILSSGFPDTLEYIQAAIKCKNSYEKLNLSDIHLKLKGLRNGGWTLFTMNPTVKSNRTSTKLDTDLLQLIAEPNWVNSSVFESNNCSYIPLNIYYPFDEKRFWPKTDDCMIQRFGVTLRNDNNNAGYNALNGLMNGPNCSKFLKITNSIASAFETVVGRKLDWEVASSSSIFELGLDSLLLMQLKLEVEEDLGASVAWNSEDLYRDLNLHSLRAALLSGTKNALRNDLLDVHTANQNGNIEPNSAFPVSDAQQRLWVLDKLGSIPSAYNVANGIRIQNGLDPTRLIAAFEHVVSHHQSLFTTFRENGTEANLIQTVSQELRQLIHLDFTDLSTKALADSTSAAMKLYEESYAAPFNLETGPLIRGTLVKMATDDYLLFVIAHHIVMDGQSHYIFYRDLWRAYANLKSGQNILKWSNGINYAKFVLESKTQSNADINYWLSELSSFNFEEPSTIPGNKERPKHFTARGKRLTFLLEESELKILFGSSDKSFTIFQKLLFLVYFNVFLYSGETDLIVGTPVSGRYGRKYRDVIGFFVNLIPLRLKIDPKQTVRDLLQRVSQMAMQGFKHSELQFDHLVKELSLPRDTGYNPIVNVNMCYHSEALEHEEIPEDLSVERVLVDNGTAKWDLYFDFLRETQGNDRGKLRFTLEYYSDLYTDEYANRIAQSLIQSLQEMSLNETADLNTLRQQACYGNLSIWRGPKRPLGSTTLAELLYTKMKISSNRTALIYNGGKMSYGFVLDAATKLSALLRTKVNLEKVDRVGLLLETNRPYSVIATMACLFSNLVFIPLDVESPAERLELICRTSKCKTLLFTRKVLALAEKLKWFPGSPVKSIVCLDRGLKDCLEVNWKAGLMNLELWDTVCREGQTSIQKGGWLSSFTRTPFTAEEMMEYKQNIFMKLKPYVKPQTTVLEIGCGSGLSLEILSPLVGSYVACDQCFEMVQYIRKLPLNVRKNVEVFQASALEAKMHLVNRKFDLVIINSVTHCFPTHSYFVNVIWDIEKMLRPGGVLFIGDVMDWSKKLELELELRRFKSENPKANTKIDYSIELFFTDSFIKDVFKCSGRFASAEIKFSSKIHTLSNELTKYRFDVIAELKVTNGMEPVTSDMKQLSYFDIEDMERMSGCTYFDTISMEDDCYILYTSGTTGSPKEVTISHAALQNFVRWASTRCQMNENTVMPLFSKLTFDFTLTPLLCPCISGGTLRLFEAFQESYPTIARSTEITHIKLSPVQLEVLCKYCSDEGIRLVPTWFIIGGEALTLSQLKSLKTFGPESFTVFNLYGPTEGTVGSICSEIRSNEINDTYKVGIGQPIENTGVVCLSKDYQVMQVGAVGTCGLFGINIFKYPCQSKAVRPIRLSHDDKEDPTMVLITDDLVHFEKDVIYHHGRKAASTVKINSIRIDLNEIKKCVMEVPGVNAAWLMPLVDRNGQQKIGILVQSAQASLSVEYLKECASLTLPKAWIPSVWKIIISNPPYNRNGKISYPEIERMLQEELRENKSNESADLDDAPASMRAIISGFQKILNLNYCPDLDASFFDMGGDSIARIYLVRHLNRNGIKFNFEDLYGNFSIRQIFHWHEARGQTCTNEEPQLKTGQNAEQFTPTPITVEHLSKFSNSSHLFLTSVPALGRFVKAVPTVCQFTKCVQTLVDRHESLRSTFKLVNSSWKQCVQPNTPNKIFVKEFQVEKTTRKISNEPQIFKIWSKMATELCLTNGPLLSSALLTYGSETYFLIVAHHLCVDVISLDILLDDLIILLSDPEVQLPKTTQISAFCKTIYELSVDANELDYWNSVNNKLPSRNVETSQESGFFCLSCTSDTVSKISSLLCVTQEIVVLSTMTFGLLKDKRSLALCMEGHGRNIKSLNTLRTVGWLTSRFPLIIEASNLCFSNYVKAVSEIIDSIPNRGANYGILKHTKQLSSSDKPHPDTMFVYQGHLDMHKSCFGVGDYVVEAMSWIEVIMTQLNSSDVLKRIPRQFGLELISWSADTETKFGCLFDKQTYETRSLEESIQYGIDAMQEMHSGFQKQDCSDNTQSPSHNECNTSTGNCEVEVQEKAQLCNSCPEQLEMHKCLEFQNISPQSSMDEDLEANTSCSEFESISSSIWARHTGSIDPRKNNPNFYFNGGTSMTAFSFLSELEDVTGKTVEMSDLYEHPHFDDFVQVLQSKPPSKLPKTTSDACNQLSIVQKEFCFLQQLAPSSSSYTESITLQIPVGLAKPKRPNFPELVSSMTTKFPSLCQKVSADWTWRHEGIIDIKALIDEEEELSIVEAVERVAQMRPTLNLCNSHLFKLLIISIPTEATYLVTIFLHHLLVDYTSMSKIGNFIRDYVSGTEVQTSPDTNSHYQMYIDCEQKYMDSKPYTEAKCKLLERLRNTSGSCTNLFYGTWDDREVYNANEVVEILNLDIGQACEAYNTNQFFFYLGAYLLTLRRYTGCNKLQTRIPVTTRTHQFQNSIGPFLNVVPFSCTMEMDSNPKQFLDFIRKEFMFYQQNGMFPFNQLFSELRKDDSNDFNESSFGNLFTLYEKPMADVVRIPVKHAKLPISLDVYNSDVAVLTWANELVDGTVAQMFIKNFIRACQILSTVPLGKLLREIDILSTVEKNLINSFNTNIPSLLENRGTGLYQLFEQNCNLNPNSVCIWESSTLNYTYAELRHMAENIAATLLQKHSLQVSYKKPVLMIMEKNVECIASVLAIWRIGTYFVPLDAAFKDKSLIKLDNVSCVITNLYESELFEKFNESLTVISTKELLQNNSISNGTYMNTDCRALPAYMMMTSGSTALPKKCIIKQDALLSMAASWKHEYQLQDNSSVNILQWAPFSFDVFIGDLTKGLLSTNGSLTLVPFKERLNVHSVGQLIETFAVTFAEFTPQFATMAIRIEPKVFQKLQTLVLGSDTLYWSTVEQIKNCLSKSTKLFNSYGLTETTVDSTLYEILAEDFNAEWKTRSPIVPIGHPLLNTKISILDPETHLPAPIGSTGVLAVSGITVSAGDIQTVELEGQTTYLTDDFGSWLPWGNIQFKGSNENTILKIRGFRINAGAIQDACSKLDSDLQTCVAFGTNIGNDSILCVALETQNKLETNEIRKALSKILPHYAIPQVILQVSALPLNSNGKIYIRILRDLARTEYTQPLSVENSSNRTLSSTENLLLNELVNTCNRSKSSIDISWSLRDQGLSSLDLMQFANVLLNLKLPNFTGVVDLFAFPSIQALAGEIDGVRVNIPTESLQDATNINSQEIKSDKICIVGLAFELPENCTTLSQFWSKLKANKSAITRFPKTRIVDIECIPNSESNGYAQAGYLNEIDKFHHSFFKISPNEAKHMSPEQRLFLQVATAAMIDSGLDLDQLTDVKIGVFVTPSETNYDLLDPCQDGVAMVGRLSSMLPTRLSYAWNLSGGSFVIDTACSSALAALDSAASSIQDGSCEMAVVGGVNLLLVPHRDKIFGAKSTQSPDFTCRPFDESANGTVPGEGVFAFLLKTESAALRDKNYIYCTLESCSRNSVGRGNGITAPSVPSQIQVLESALRTSNLTADDVSFVETHGTGTALGDQVELSALESVYRKRTMPLTLGATKPVFGHLDACAGFLSLVKTICCFQMNEVPSILNLKNPNVYFNPSLFKKSAETLNHRKTSRCYAGVSAFGISGTNVHVILSYMKPKINPDSRASLYFILPIPDDASIEVRHELYIQYAQHFILGLRETTLADFCATQACTVFSMRSLRGVVVLEVSSVEELLKKLNLLVTKQQTNETSTILDLDCPKLQKIRKSMAISNRSPYMPKFLFGKHRHWPNPTQTPASNQPTLELVLQKRYHDCKELLRNINLAEPKDLSEALNEFGTSLIVEFLSTTPLARNSNWKIGATMENPKAFNITGIHSRYRKLFFVMLRQLHDSGLIRFCNESQNTFVVKEMLLSSDKSDALAKRGNSNFPAYSDCFNFPLYCARYYEDVLLGEMSPLTVIYPKGNLNFMNEFTKLGDELGNVYYDMYIQTIAEYVIQKARHNPDRTIRILEVGAGMGYVTRQLAPKILEEPNSRIQYWFTDLGKSFVENGRKEFYNFGTRMKFAVFDITRPLEDQGILDSFDIIISYNVIHTTTSVMASLRNLKQSLSSDGYLCIIESSRNETWATLAWGILDGWWYFTDYELRPADPMLTKEVWIHVLNTLFPSVCVCPETEDVEKVFYVCSNKEKGTFKILPSPLSKSIDVKHRNGYADENLCRLEDLTYEQATTKLIEIWRKCLNIIEVSEDDVFQELGGDSLLVIQMMEEIRQVFGIQIEIAHAFAHPKLSSLSRFITKIWKTQNNSPTLNLLSTESNQPAKTNDNAFPSKMTMLLFPGQGSQKLGMCQSMLDSPEAMRIFEKVKQILNVDIIAMCTQENSLTRTDFIQLALFVSSVAKALQLKSENPKLLESVEAVAGLSVGEISALVFAEAIEFEEALQFVYARGKSMQAEVEKCVTKMVSVLGPSKEQLQDFIRNEFPTLSICTYLADNQHTVGGPSEICEEFKERLLEEPTKLKMSVIDVRILRVGGAFHSEYMKPCFDQMTRMIDQMKIRKPKCAVVMNVDGKVASSVEGIRYNLKQQILRPVQWKTIMTSALDLSIRKFIEISPSCVLTPVQNRIKACKDARCDAQFIRI